MTGVKLKMRDRWKRRSPRREALVTPIVSALEVPAPFPPAPPVGEALTPVDQARIAQWVKARIVSWAPDRCFCCRLPIVYGAKWVELVNNGNRARFHSDCLPEWKLQQEELARRVLGLPHET